MKKLLAITPILLAGLIAGCGSTATLHSHSQHRPAPTASTKTNTPAQKTETVASVKAQFLAYTAVYAPVSNAFIPESSAWINNSNTPLTTIKTEMAKIAAVTNRYSNQLGALSQEAPQSLHAPLAEYALKLKAVAYAEGEFAKVTSFSEVKNATNNVFTAGDAASPYLTATLKALALIPLASPKASGTTGRASTTAFRNALRQVQAASQLYVSQTESWKVTTPIATTQQNTQVFAQALVSYNGVIQSLGFDHRIASNIRQDMKTDLTFQTATVASLESLAKTNVYAKRTLAVKDGLSISTPDNVKVAADFGVTIP
jgi:hypothetical protein